VRTFTLTGRADRIERLADGVYALLDFKTGRVATAKQVRQGLAPQLTLGAAMLQQGGFEGIPAGGHVEGIGYVQLRGGEPAGKDCMIEWKDATADAEAKRAFERLRARVMLFEDEETPYAALTHPMWSAGYGDYDHLARVKEWSQGPDDDETGATP
jgi:ATP-dependent helicase/nuclease subunit B